MEKHIPPHDYIAAAGRLYQYSANKRFGVTPNSFIDDAIGDIANYINAEISARTGCDVFKTANLEDLLRYEAALSGLISKFTENFIVKRDVSTEADVLLSFNYLDKDYFKDKDVRIKGPFEETVEQFPVSTDEVLRACKEPICIMRSNTVDDGGSYNFICSGEIFIDGRQFRLSYHVSERNGLLKLCNLFIISNLLFDEYSSNPARLFLAVLDKYGIDLIIAGERKRLFGYKVVPLPKGASPTLDTVMRLIGFSSVGGNDKITLFYEAMVDSDNVAHLAFVYGINITQYLAYLDEILKAGN